MVDSAFKTYKIDDRSYVAFIKREINHLVKQAGFGALRGGEVNIIVSELTSNLIKFTDGGEIIYRLNDTAPDKFFEFFCIDNGPGNNDMQRMMLDGTSSANTLGHGLGAVKRLSDVFQIYSRAGWGTVAYSKSFAVKAEKKWIRPADVQTGIIQTCYPGEVLCGDAFDILKNGNETNFFVCDGLGHGANAYEAAQTAVEAFRSCGASEPVDIIRYMHEKLKKTRGVVGTVAIYNHNKRHWRICGVGNIMVKLCSYIESRSYTGHNGIIGGNIPNTMNNFVSNDENYNFLILASDGIKTRWDLISYQLLLKQSLPLMAGVLYKDNKRGNDDATIVVVKVT